MPRILELKEIDGQIWARLDVDLETTPQPVSLLTAPELEHIKDDVIEACAVRAWEVCSNDIYVKEVGLEKNCAAEIRKLKSGRR